MYTISIKNYNIYRAKIQENKMKILFSNLGLVIVLTLGELYKQNAYYPTVAYSKLCRTRTHPFEERKQAKLY